MLLRWVHPLSMWCKWSMLCVWGGVGGGCCGSVTKLWSIVTYNISHDIMRVFHQVLVRMCVRTLDVLQSDCFSNKSLNDIVCPTIRCLHIDQSRLGLVYVLYPTKGNSCIPFLYTTVQREIPWDSHIVISNQFAAKLISEALSTIDNSIETGRVRGSSPHYSLYILLLFLW